MGLVTNDERITLMALHEKTTPQYPYDKKVGIQLPEEIEQEIKALVSRGRKVEAGQKVFKLTRAGLKISKDYVDRLTS